VVTFVDTSALYALLDETDNAHRSAVVRWETLVNTREQIMTTDYVRLEAWALIQRRLGLAAARKFSEALLPVMDIHRVTEGDFATAAHWLFTANRRDVGLVDATSFAVMRRESIDVAFTFDRHFEEEGFKVI
jgi:predicted nucleic acid-binding protein